MVVDAGGFSSLAGALCEERGPRNGFLLKISQGAIKLLAFRLVQAYGSHVLPPPSLAAFTTGYRATGVNNPISYSTKRIVSLVPVL